MESDAGAEDEGPFFAWLPPEDRLWLHPSEAGARHDDGSDRHDAGSDRHDDGSDRHDDGSDRHDDGDDRLRRAARSGSASTLQEVPPDDYRLRPAWLRPSGAAQRTWVVAVVAGMIGALAASGIGVAGGWWNHDTTVVRAVIPSTPAVSLAASNATTDWSAIDDAVAPSVVGVSVLGAGGTEYGSGLLLLDGGSDGAYVVTDRSIFTDAQESGYMGSVSVTFSTGAEVKGKLLAQDPLSGLALVAVPNQGRVFPDVGTVADIHDANSVLAVGARNVAGGSAYTGSVSGEDQEITLSDGGDMDNLIGVAIPAMAAPSIGGPLVDQEGLVVGITVSVPALDPTAEQGTYAVPIDVAMQFARQAVDGEEVTHAWIGVTGADDVPTATARAMGVDGGAQASTVVPGGPASRAGVAPNDIITSLDGHAVTSTGGLVSILADCAPGHDAPITYVHDGRTVQSTVAVMSEPADS